MIALLVPDICGQSVTHKSSTTILMDLTRRILGAAVNTSGVEFTSGEPNQITFTGGTCCLHLGGVGGTSAVVL